MPKHLQVALYVGNLVGCIAFKRGEVVHEAVECKRLVSEASPDMVSVCGTFREMLGDVLDEVFAEGLVGGVLFLVLEIQQVFFGYSHK